MARISRKWSTKTTFVWHSRAKMMIQRFLRKSFFGYFYFWGGYPGLRAKSKVHSEIVFSLLHYVDGLLGYDMTFSFISAVSMFILVLHLEWKSERSPLRTDAHLSRQCNACASPQRSWHFVHIFVLSYDHYWADRKWMREPASFLELEKNAESSVWTLRRGWCRLASVPLSNIVSLMVIFERALNLVMKWCCLKWKWQIMPNASLVLVSSFVGC